MFDEPAHQRMRGHAIVGLQRSGARTALKDLRQSGAAKVFLPQCDGWPEVVLLNTAGGITGGDALRYELRAGEGTRIVATTQTAERAYRAVGDVAGRLDVEVSVSSGATLHWLPQETILFDGCNVSRKLSVDLAEDAGFLFADTLVLGRTAMGETLTHMRLEDRRVVRRAGRMIYAEPLRLDAEILARRGQTAVLGDGVALTTVGYFAPDAEDLLDTARAALASIPDSVRGAASAWNSQLILRMLSADAFALRRATAHVLHALRHAQPLPRVWQM